MKTYFEPFGEAHRTGVIDIFNYYVENSFAAWPEVKVPYDFFNVFLMMTKGYPAVAVIDERNEVAGFGFLRAYNPLPAFKSTAEVTYFISRDAVRAGTGSALLSHLEKEAAAMGVTNFLAGISSLNEPSLWFHRKNGFVECGRFRGIGRKKNTSFDVVWMQKEIRP